MQQTQTSNKISGFHHLAICTGDIKGQIDFFTDKLGMELQSMYWMHGVPDTWHAFLRLNDESSIAFVSNPQIKQIPTELGHTHSGNPGANSAAGTMQHVALKVDSYDELLDMRDRLRTKGVPVLGPMDHGMCFSIYFAGLENLSLELAFSAEALDQDMWIDTEVTELAGISPEELEKYKKPEEFKGQKGAVPQPELDDTKGPHMTNYPPGVYEKSMQLPDDFVLNMVESTPPGKT